MTKSHTLLICWELNPILFRSRYDSPNYRPGYHSQVSEPGARGREGNSGSREGYHSLDNRYRDISLVTMCDHSLMSGVTGTGAASPGRGGARRRVRATASGPRTGTAGQTGEQCQGVTSEQIACLFLSQYDSLVSKCFQIIMEMLKKKGRMMYLPSVWWWGKLASERITIKHFLILQA